MIVVLILKQKELYVMIEHLPFRVGGCNVTEHLFDEKFGAAVRRRALMMRLDQFVCVCVCVCVCCCVCVCDTAREKKRERERECVSVFALDNNSPLVCVYMCVCGCRMCVFVFSWVSL